MTSALPIFCEVCGTPLKPGNWGRCYVCNRACCRACKGEGYHLCNACWNTPDGIEADRITEPSTREGTGG